MLKVGIDVGSTTMKTVALREDNTLVYSDYQRHRSQIIEKGREMLNALMENIGDEEVTISLSGSAGMEGDTAAGNSGKLGVSGSDPFLLRRKRPVGVLDRRRILSGGKFRRGEVYS